MRARSLLRVLLSSKTIIGLLCLLGVLLLLNVAVPQASVLGDAALDALAQGHPALYFVLVTLGLGHMPTSPVFLVVLALFFLQLALVLVARAGPTWRRIRARSPSRDALDTWTRLDEALAVPAPPGWSRAAAARILRGYGYRVHSVHGQGFWGVKHRTAPLGFLLFHLSFFFLCAGGALIYYTRFVATAVVTEGQEFAGQYKQILRAPPLGRVPSLRFVVEDVDPRFESGEPTHLEASLSFRQAGGFVERRARVNHPARWGSSSVLVQQAGLAPVLWLQDARGFTVDRVAVAAWSRPGSEATTEVPLGRRFRAEIDAATAGDVLPPRTALPRTPLHLRLFRRADPTAMTGEDELLFEGSLRPGESAPVGAGRLVLEDLRYWVGVQVVSERGGGILEAGFLAGIAGLVWRLLFYRREVGLTWDDETIRLVGRSESYPWRFRAELESLFQTLRSDIVAAGSPVDAAPRAHAPLEEP